MKITAIKTLVVNARMRNWVLVKVETDQPGLYGWGEGTLEWKTKGVVGSVEDLSVLLIGQALRRRGIVTMSAGTAERKQQSIREWGASAGLVDYKICAIEKTGRRCCSRVEAAVPVNAKPEFHKDKLPAIPDPFGNGIAGRKQQSVRSFRTTGGEPTASDAVFPPCS